MQQNEEACATIVVRGAVSRTSGKAYGRGFQGLTPRTSNCYPERSEGSKILAISGVLVAGTLDSSLRSE